MLETTTDSVNLPALETLLQQRLQSEALSIVPLMVSCLLREENLIILIHASETISSNPSEIFLLLKKILKTEKMAQFYRVQIYLIVPGQAPEDADFSAVSSLTQFSQLDGDSVLETRRYRVRGSVSLVQELLQADRQSWILLGNLDKQKPFIFPARRQYWLKNFPQNREQLNLTKLPIRGMGIGIGCVIFLGILYGLTRPCLFGQCREIFQAEQLIEQALTPFQTIPSDTVIMTSQQQFEQAIDKLKIVPRWSSFYREAVSRLQEYQIKLSHLETLKIAIEKGEKAKSISQNSPLSIKKWEEIKQLWQEAIASLQSLPPESSFYLSAAVKIREYHKNLEEIAGNLQAEKQASVSLETSQRTAKIAKLRQNAAQSLAEWQLVYSTWQTAVQRLSDILPGTTPYAESRKLLENYMAELISVGIRKRQEEFAEDIYNKAVNQAKLAEQLAAKNKLTEAVAQWRNALTYIKQIPKNTFQNNHAQPLITAYTLSFNQAENKLKSAIELQKNQSALEKICSESIRICNYNITDRVIQISLTPTYIQQVWNTALQAKAQDNLQTQVELLNYFSRVEQSLQMLSNHTNKQVAVYNADGSLATFYQPRN